MERISISPVSFVRVCVRFGHAMDRSSGKSHGTSRDDFRELSPSSLSTPLETRVTDHTLELFDATLREAKSSPRPRARAPRPACRGPTRLSRSLRKSFRQVFDIWTHISREYLFSRRALEREIATRAFQRSLPIHGPQSIRENSVSKSPHRNPEIDCFRLGKCAASRRVRPRPPPWPVAVEFRESWETESDEGNQELTNDSHGPLLSKTPSIVQIGLETTEIRVKKDQNTNRYARWTVVFRRNSLLSKAQMQREATQRRSRREEGRPRTKDVESPREKKRAAAERDQGGLGDRNRDRRLEVRVAQPDVDEARA